MSPINVSAASSSIDVTAGESTVEIEVSAGQVDVDVIGGQGPQGPPGQGGASSWNDLEDKPADFPPEAHTHTAGDIDSESAAAGYVLTANGEGGATWEEASGGGASSWNELNDKPAALDGGYFAIDDDGFLCVRSENLENPVKVETVGGSYGGLLMYSLEFVGEGEGAGILFADDTQQSTAWPGSLSYNDLDDLPSLFDGSYASLSNVPSTFTPASHAHGNLSNDGLVNGNTASGQIVVTTTGGALTTSATIASSAVSGLGGAATLSVGTTAGTVAAGDHTHAQLHDRSHAITSSSDHTATAWRVFYSGSNGTITELALGANGTVLTSGGASAAPTFSALPAGGTKTVIRFTPADNQPPSSNFATLDTRNSFLVLEFDASTQESANFIGVIPEGATLASGLMVRLWWMADTATSGNVRWGVSFERTGTDNDSDSLSSVTEANGAASGTSGIETVTEITATAIDSLVAGDRFRLRVARIAADAVNDTMLGDAQLVAVEVRVA